MSEHHHHDHDLPKRRELLDELQRVFAGSLAFGAWGRLLVEVRPDASGALRVADVVVEEIVGSEAEVDACFGRTEAGEIMMGLPVVIEALTSFEPGADLERLGGGTFVCADTAEGERLEFLPGLVRAPSVGFDGARDDVLRRATERDLARRFDLAGASIETDMERGTLRAVRGAVTVLSGEQVVLGSFSRGPRSWVWAAHNPSLAPAARARAAALLDAMPDRSSWEVSTPGLVTDEPTAWALAWWVALEAQLEGVVRVDVPDGFVALGVTRLALPA